MQKTACANGLTRCSAMTAYSLMWVWLAVWFVVTQVSALGPPGSLMGLVYLSALALCVFNTASIVAMVRHYEQAKEHIYRQDIEHLDAIAVSNKQHHAS